MIQEIQSRIGENRIDALLEELDAPRFYSRTTLQFAFRKRQLVVLMNRWLSLLAPYLQTEWAMFRWVVRDRALRGADVVRFLPGDDYGAWNKRKLVAAILVLQHLMLLILRSAGVKDASRLLEKYRKSGLCISSEHGGEQPAAEAAEAAETSGISDKSVREVLEDRIRKLEFQISAAKSASEALAQAQKEMHEVGLYLRNAYASEIARGEHANQTLCQVLRRYLEKERMMAKAVPLRRMWLALKLW